MKSDPANSKSHQEVMGLLPWYTNETLSEGESAKVSAHLADCPTCLEEVDALRVLQSAVKSSSEALPRPAPDSLAGLLARIEEGRAAPARAGVKDPGVKTRGDLGAKARAWWAQLPETARAVVALQAAAVLLLAGLSAALWERGRRLETLSARETERADRSGSLLAEAQEELRDDRFESLSGPTTRDEGEEVRLVVVFGEAAQARDIKNLLTGINARIVNGPTPAGFYTVAVPLPKGADARSVASDAQARLRGRPDLVRLAEVESAP